VMREKPTSSNVAARSRRWIPAFAGMTRSQVCHHAAQAGVQRLDVAPFKTLDSGFRRNDAKSGLPSPRRKPAVTPAQAGVQRLVFGVSAAGMDVAHIQARGQW